MKSIYGRLKKFTDVKPLPILIHGDKMSTELYGVTERIVNPRLARIKMTMETLKLSAANSGSYSLSANQLGISNAIFVMHKELLDSQSEAFNEKRFLHPRAFQVQEETPFPDTENDKLSLADSQLLDPSDFRLFLNPRVLSETKHQIVDWEYCLSFPSIRCMVKRPQAITVNYLDEEGAE